jgi:hypothetical protein
LLELIVLLRLLHIVTGAFWMGGIVLSVFFIEPTAKAFGRTGDRFLAYALFRARLMPVLVVAATVSLVAGAVLYWIDSGGLQIGWILSRTGLGFTVGGAAAVLAFAIALVVLKPHFDKLAALAGAYPIENGEIDDRPADWPLEEKRIRRWSVIQASLLVFTVGAMAIARYLG